MDGSADSFQDCEFPARSNCKTTRSFTPLTPRENGIHGNSVRSSLRRCAVFKAPVDPYCAAACAPPFSIFYPGGMVVLDLQSTDIRSPFAFKTADSECPGHSPLQSPFALFGFCFHSSKIRLHTSKVHLHSLDSVFTLQRSVSTLQKSICTLQSPFALFKRCCTLSFLIFTSKRLRMTIKRR